MIKFFARPLPLYLALCAAAAVWIDFSRIHLGQTSDSLIPILVSLQHWTPFYWEQSRFGMLVPLLALPFDDPLANLLVQDGLMIFSGLAAVGLLARFFVRSRAWFAAACGSCACTIVFLAEPLRCDYFLAQPYGISFSLGLGALLVVERGNTWTRWSIALGMILLASWVNLAVGPALLALVVIRWLGRRPAWRRAPVRLIVLLVALERAAPFRNHHVTRLAPVDQWMPAAEALVSNLLHQAGPGYRLALLLLAGAAGVAMLAGAGRRRRIAVRVFGSMFAGTILLLGLAAISRWSALNGHTPRYAYMALVALQTGFIAAIAMAISARQCPRLGVRALAALCLLAATGWTYGTPSLATVRACLHERCGVATDDILHAGCTHIAGDYWRVWPAVFHANWTLHQRGSTQQVWGVTYRSLPTRSHWAAADLATAGVAVLGGHEHAENMLNGVVPSLRVAAAGR
jgi:hypothetical protein